MQASSGKSARNPDHLLPNLCHGEGLLGLLVIAALLAFMVALLRSGISGFDFTILGKAILLSFWIALLSAGFLCLARNSLSGLSERAAAVVNYLLILLAATICAAAGSLWSAYSTQSILHVDLMETVDIVVVAAIPAGIMLRMLYLRQKLHRQQQAELESRIEALQSKIRPHFLFNSMNSLASLIGFDAVKAERMVEDLSDLFRYALSDSREPVTLAQEIDACNRYLQVEKLRLEERLEYAWHISLEPEVFKVPPLILQPLLENAVFHGIQPSPDGGEVHISIKRSNEWVEIEVVNSLSDQISVTSGNRIAQKNLRYRLEAFFPAATLETFVAENNYYTVIRFKPREEKT